MFHGFRRPRQHPICPPFLLAENGSKIFEYMGSVLYVILVVVFFARLFSKRAKYATNTRLASIRDGNFDPDSVEEPFWCAISC